MKLSTIEKALLAILLIAAIAAIAYNAGIRDLLDEAQCVSDRSVALYLEAPEPDC